MRLQPRCIGVALAATACTAHAAPTNSGRDICAAPSSLGRLTDALPNARAALLAGLPLNIVTL